MKIIVKNRIQQIFFVVAVIRVTLWVTFSNPNFNMIPY